MKHVRTILIVSLAMIGLTAIAAIACGGEEERLSLVAYDRWCEDFEERLELSVSEDDAETRDRLEDILDDVEGVNPPKEVEELHDVIANMIEFSVRVWDGDAGSVPEMREEYETLEQDFEDAIDDMPRYIREEVPNCRYLGTQF